MYSRWRNDTGAVLRDDDANQTSHADDVFPALGGERQDRRALALCCGTGRWRESLRVAAIRHPLKMRAGRIHWRVLPLPSRSGRGAGYVAKHDVFRIARPFPVVGVNGSCGLHRVDSPKRFAPFAIEAQGRRGGGHGKQPDDQKSGVALCEQYLKGKRQGTHESKRAGQGCEKRDGAASGAPAECFFLHRVIDPPQFFESLIMTLPLSFFMK
ncbi:hypothetical protein [Noviherbaspirillum sp.]|uniref:hypothetical protein n=1 Tax=Noviherbaspirillum sp. TaxID=1926288 RepID=UPI002B48C0A0|nr:hypothetical protein [Noviherbaspirillum sp.]HJV82049.1 hypothetical protein [Noviherbaspirillum sp.]